MDEDIPNEYPKACKNCALTLSTTTEVKYYGSEVERKVVHKAYAVAPVHLAARYQCRNGPLQKLLAAGADPNITYSFQLSNDSKKLYEMKKFVDKYYPYIGAATISALHDTRNIDHVAILARAGSNMAANDSLGFYPMLDPLSQILGPHSMPYLFGTGATSRSWRRSYEVLIFWLDDSFSSRAFLRNC